MDERTAEETQRVARVRVQAFYDSIRPEIEREIAGLPKRLSTLNARSSIKISQVHAAADKIFSHATNHAACRRGCSHCCNVAVRITTTEAEFIGEHIGVAPITVKETTSHDVSSFSDKTPCPFLTNDECSIYQWRPLECRSNFNFDKDNYWCRHENWDKPGAAIPKPYIEALNQAYGMVSRSPSASASSIIADIRDFFPRGTSGL